MKLVDSWEAPRNEGARIVNFDGTVIAPKENFPEDGFTYVRYARGTGKLDVIKKFSQEPMNV